MSDAERAKHEEDYFRYLLTLPGARKAKQGVLLDHPDGGFHVRGLVKVPDDLPPEAHLYLEFCTEKETRRILEIKNSSDYLMKRRADAIADHPRLVRQITTKKDAWAKAGRTWSLTGYYNSLNNPAKAYIEKLPKRDRLRLNAVPYGFAPLNQPNGLCFRSLVGDVIIVSDSLRQFFYFWCLASLGDFYKLDLEQRVHALIIALRIMKGSEAPDFEIDPREKLASAVRAEVNADVDWMMQFTFAHEFAHYSLGDLDASVEPSTDEVVFAHALEYAADARAISSHGLNGFRARKLLWAAHQVLLSFHALERFGETRNDFPSFSVSNGSVAQIA